MKFGHHLMLEAFEPYRPYYIAYKDLKKAIRVMTGTDMSQLTIAELTSNFGNISALAGPNYRPPESRFQDLLNFEVEKINNFSALTYSSIKDSLRGVLQRLRDEPPESLDSLEIVREAAEESALSVERLDKYVRLNFLGFRKITKKYDKHNKSAATSWYLARLLKEKFVNLNFDYLVQLVSSCFCELTGARQRLTAAEQIDSTYRAEKKEVSLQPILAASPPVDRSKIISTSYLVSEDAIMGVRLQLARHLQLVSLGHHLKIGDIALRRGHSGGAAGGRGSNDGVVSEDFSGDSRSNIARSSRLSVDPSTGELLNAAIYKFESTRASACCLYFATSASEAYCAWLKASGVESFRARLPSLDDATSAAPSSSSSSSSWSSDGPGSISATRVLRLRWAVGSGCSPDDDVPVVVELVDPTEPAHSHHEWHHAPPAGDLVAGAAQDDLDRAVVLSRGQCERLMRGHLEWQGRHYRTMEEITSQAAQLAVPATLRVALHRVLCGQRPICQRWSHRTAFRSSGCSDAVFAYLDEAVFFTAAGSGDTCGEESRNEGSGGDADPVEAICWAPPQLAPLLLQFEAHRSPFGLLSISCSSHARPDFIAPIAGSTLVMEVCGYLPCLHGSVVTRSGGAESFPLNRGLSAPAPPSWLKFVTANETAPDASPPTAAAAAVGTHSVVLNRRASAPISPSLTRKKLLGSHLPPRSSDHVVRVDVLASQPRSRLLHEHAVALQQKSAAAAAFEYGARQDGLREEFVRVGSKTSGQAGDDRFSSAIPVAASAARTLVLEPPVSVREASLRDLKEPLLFAAALETVNSPEPNSVITRASSMTTDARAGRWLSWISCGVIPCCRQCRPMQKLASCWPVWLKFNSPVTAGRVCGAAAVRVEPKTFFANERTLLQWMNTAVLLSTISITLLNFGTASGHLAGLIMAPVALFFIIYSFLVYMRRSYSLERKDPINYNDRLGPAILVLCLISALTAIIVLNVAYGSSSNIIDTSTTTTTTARPPSLHKGGELAIAPAKEVQLVLAPKAANSTALLVASPPSIEPTQLPFAGPSDTATTLLPSDLRVVAESVFGDNKFLATRQPAIAIF